MKKNIKIGTKIKKTYGNKRLGTLILRQNMYEILKIKKFN